MLEPSIEEKDLYKHKLDFLYKAIDDTQNAIRFADTKAAAVVAFWGLICTVLMRTGDKLLVQLSRLEQGIDWLLVLGCFLVGIISFLQSVWLVYLSINPRSNPSHHVIKSGFSPKGLYFLAEMTPQAGLFTQLRSDPKVKLKKPLDQYLAEMGALTSRDLYSELVFELQKVSFIRNLKMTRLDNSIKAIHRFFVSFVIVAILLIGNNLEDIEGVPALEFKLNILLSCVFIGSHLLLKLIFKYLPKKDFVYLLEPILRAAVVFGVIFMSLGIFNLAHFIIYTTLLYILQKGYLQGKGVFKWLAGNVLPIALIIFLSITK